MPRIRQLKRHYMVKDIGAIVHKMLKDNKITITKASQEIGICRTTLETRLKHGNLTYEDLIVIFKMCKASEDDVIRLMMIEVENDSEKDLLIKK